MRGRTIKIYNFKSVELIGCMVHNGTSAYIHQKDLMRSSGLMVREGRDTSICNDEGYDGEWTRSPVQWEWEWEWEYCAIKCVNGILRGEKSARRRGFGGWGVQVRGGTSAITVLAGLR